MKSAPSLPKDLPAVPRRNGEIRFDAPWESRAFGLVVSMVERGAWTWPEFAARLDGVDVSGEDTAHFYEHWLEALEDLLLERVLLEPTEIESRIAQQAASDQEHSH